MVWSPAVPPFDSAPTTSYSPFIDTCLYLMLFSRYIYSEVLPSALARHVMQSAPSVRLFVLLFTLSLLNRVTVNLDLLHVYEL